MFLEVRGFDGKRIHEAFRQRDAEGSVPLSAQHPRTLAGGLGAGLMAFANGKIVSGIDIVCEALDFDRRLEGADLVISGEGRVDSSTVYNKAPVGVARRAAGRGIPVITMAGSLGRGYELVYQHGITAVVCIADRPMSVGASIGRTYELLSGAAERTARLLRLHPP